MRTNLFLETVELERRNSVEIEDLSRAMDEKNQAKEKAVIEARRQRGRAKGSLTQCTGVLQKLMTETTKIKNVEERLKHLLEAINKFELAHDPDV